MINIKLLNYYSFGSKIHVLFLVILLGSCKNNSNSETDYSFSAEAESFMQEPSTKVFMSAYSWAVSSQLIPIDNQLINEFIEIAEDSLHKNKKMEYAETFRRLVNDNYNKVPEKRLNLENYKTYYETVINKDSSVYFLEKGKQNYKTTNYLKAIQSFDKSLNYYPINNEARIYKANATKKAKKFDDAIGMFNSILRDTLIKDIDKQNLKLEIANCYKLLGDKLLAKGKREEAIIKYSIAADKGDNKAKIKYEKLNPMIRKIIGYRTKCCDGSYSNARSEGACSHHDGVCDWNEPIYEEHRKYE